MLNYLFCHSQNTKQDIFKCSTNTRLNSDSFPITLLLDNVLCGKVKASNCDILLKS